MNIASIARVFAVLATLLTAGAQAAPVTVTGTFTSFSSWVFDPSVQQSLVNGTALTSSGTVVGTNGAIDYFQSNTLSFAGPTTSVDFSYGQAGFTPPLPRPNNFSFVGGAADVVAGQDFALGTFSFTNGQWYPQADVGFLLTTHSSDAALDGHTFAGFLHLVSTSPEDGIPEDEADYFYVTELNGQPVAGINSARVYETSIQPPGNPGNVDSFALMGHIDSLVPTGFVSLGGAGFTNASLEPALAAAVPEPESYAMLLAGLGLLQFVVRRRNPRPLY
jgi:PEP-CTERM motif